RNESTRRLSVHTPQMFPRIEERTRKSQERMRNSALPATQCAGKTHAARSRPRRHQWTRASRSTLGCSGGPRALIHDSLLTLIEQVEEQEVVAQVNAAV